MIAVIDRRKCASDQRICKPLRECTTSTIFWVEDEVEALGSCMEIDPEKCDGCGICVPLCCGNCIEMRR